MPHQKRKPFWVSRLDMVKLPPGIAVQQVEIANLKDQLTHITIPLKVEINSENYSEVELVAALIEERLRQLLIATCGASHGLDTGYELPYYPHLNPSSLVIQYRSSGATSSKDIAALVLQEIANMREEGVTEEQLKKVQRHQRSADLFWKSNNEYWIYSLTNYALWRWPMTGLFSERATKNLPCSKANELISSFFDLQNFRVVHATSQ